jgi:transcriptional regulator with XRE-family HTH domain
MPSISASAAEFLRLLHHAGWSQAEAARRLQITPGAVSQICSGRTQARASTLNLLRLMVAQDLAAARRARKSDPRPAAPSWEEELLAPIRRLPESSRHRLLAALKPMIQNWR